jgi:hypothetical protein
VSACRQQSATATPGRNRAGRRCTPVRAQWRRLPTDATAPRLASRLNEDELVDELLGDDAENTAPDGSPPKRPKSNSHHRQHTHSRAAGADRPRRDAPAAEERSQGAAAGTLAEETAAVFSRLSASSSGSPVGARAAAEAAAAFAVGDGPAQPPGTIHPGASLAAFSPMSAEVRCWAWCSGKPSQRTYFSIAPFSLLPHHCVLSLVLPSSAQFQLCVCVDLCASCPETRADPASGAVRARSSSWQESRN